MQLWTKDFGQEEISDEISKRFRNNNSYMEVKDTSHLVLPGRLVSFRSNDPEFQVRKLWNFEDLNFALGRFPFYAEKGFIRQRAQLPDSDDDVNGDLCDIEDGLEDSLIQYSKEALRARDKIWITKAQLLSGLQKCQQEFTPLPGPVLRPFFSSTQHCQYLNQWHENWKNLTESWALLMKTCSSVNTNFDSDSILWSNDVHGMTRITLFSRCYEKLNNAASKARTAEESGMYTDALYILYRATSYFTGDGHGGPGSGCGGRDLNIVPEIVGKENELARYHDEKSGALLKESCSRTVGQYLRLGDYHEYKCTDEFFRGGEMGL